jgi:hypothetical protein
LGGEDRAARSSVATVAEKDPVTGEDIDDTQFEALFVAVIGDRPTAATPGKPGAAAGAAPAAKTPEDDFK